MKITIAGILTTLIASVTAYAAPPQRTFIASNGNDAADCSRSTPCRNFLAAVNAVAPGGEVIVLDSAGYGPVTLVKSVSIIAPTGVYAGVTAFSGATAIDIGAGATDSITLRGLTLNGLGAQNGIRILTAKDVHVSECMISGFDGASNSAGIAMLPNGTAQLHVRDSVLKRNAYGLYSASQTFSSTANVSVSRVRMETNSQDGMYLTDGTYASVTESIAAGNAGTGFHLVNNTYLANLVITNSVASHNSYGIASQGTAGAHLYMSGSSADHNDFVGFATFGTAGFASLGNNMAQSNGTDVNVPLTAITPD
jgi:hypothetical protein